MNKAIRKWIEENHQPWRKLPEFGTPAGFFWYLPPSDPPGEAATRP